MQRRHFLRQAGVTSARHRRLRSLRSTRRCATRKPSGGTSRTSRALAIRCRQHRADPPRQIAVTGVYVCTRPFRGAGPRIETERLDHKTIVHNYGHGGSGWSLSWGSSAFAVRLARRPCARDRRDRLRCAGRTSALLAQRAGLAVTRNSTPGNCRRMCIRCARRACGRPDSRICDAQSMRPRSAIAGREMTRTLVPVPVLINPARVAPQANRMDRWLRGVGSAVRRSRAGRARRAGVRQFAFACARS